MNTSYPYYLANEAQMPNQDLVVTDKYTGEAATRVALASPETIAEAIAAAAVHLEDATEGFVVE